MKTVLKWSLGCIGLVVGLVGLALLSGILEIEFAGESVRSVTEAELELLAKHDASVILYGDRDCSACDHARQLLDEMGVPYVYLDVKLSREALDEFRAIEGQTVPTTLSQSVRINGFSKTNLQQHLAEMGERSNAAKL